MSNTHRMFVLFAAILSLYSAGLSHAAEWVNISDPVIAQLQQDGKKIGYPGHTAGVTVDPKTGDVYMVICDNGMWKSTDQGKTFSRVDGGAIGGRCETGWALNFDPAGSKLACFMIYGAAGSTHDAGKTWKKWTTNHLDFGAVDWAGGGKTMLSFRHESGGVLCVTNDGGATWSNLGKAGADNKIAKEDRDYKGLGLFDAKTFVATRGEGILRSADAGATWDTATIQHERGAKVKFVAPVMTLHGNIGYWPSDVGLLASKDQGKTWAVLCDTKALMGPYFGKSDQHFIMAGKDGLIETKDGAKTWEKVAPLPTGFTVGLVGPNYAWDVERGIFYASTMGKPTFKWERK